MAQAERSEPNDDDGQMGSQDMPTTDGEMADKAPDAEIADPDSGSARLGSATGRAATAAAADDPSGMRGQVDDSASGLGPGDDETEARRGIPQVDHAVDPSGDRSIDPAIDDAIDEDDDWDGADSGPE